MNQFTECDQFQGRMRAICRGEVLLLSQVNNFRAHYGLAPLTQTVSRITQEPPPLIIRGWNFARALARWTSAGMPRCTEEEISERLAICQACEFLRDGHCTKCGCACIENNRLMNKLALSTEHCPLEKW